MHRVAGVNEMFKEMECSKSAGEPIYASVTELNSSQQRPSECAELCNVPPSPGDVLSFEMVDRALPNPYASLPLEGSSSNDYVNTVTVSEASCVNPQGTGPNTTPLSPIPPPLNNRIEHADDITVSADRISYMQLDHMPLPDEQLDHMTLQCEQSDHLVLPCDQPTHTHQVTQKHNQSDDLTATYSQVGIQRIISDVYAVSERNNLTSCDEIITNQSPSGDHTTSDAAIPLRLVPAEDDYVEMKST